MKARFEVCTEGMRELQLGREPWQLAKEVVSNAWDENTSMCQVWLKSLTSRTAYFSVYDNGKGFKDISDAWTLMKHTDKRLHPEVRGRFNIGEKEILSVAQAAKITTAGKVILFPKTGGRRVRANQKPFHGTLVEVWVLWGANQVKETIDRLKRMLPPKGIQYEVNGETIFPKTPHKTTQGVLETVIQPRPGEPMVTTRRITQLEIYQPLNGTKPELFEMGIPVQTIDCPYSVNVLQKIPLPPNRDTVKDSYLQDVYALVLNATAEEVQDAAANWTRMAIEDPKTSPEAVKTMVTKRYGDKVALWSSDTRSNEKAMLAGYTIVHGSTLSEAERGVFQSEQVGIRHTSDIFPINYAFAESLSEEQLTKGMKMVRQYAKQLYRGLFGKELRVSFFDNSKIAGDANFGYGQIEFNIGRLGKHWFHMIIQPQPGVFVPEPQHTELLIHEFAHTKGVGHEPTYYRSVVELAGKAVHLALEHPEVFQVTEEEL